MRRTLSGTMLAAAAVLCALSAVACADDRAGGTVSLVILAWEDYVPPEVITAFEQETGIRVRIETFGTQHEAISALQSNPTSYDIVIVTGDILGQLAELRLVTPLDRDQVPNIANIDPRFLGWSWDPENRFSVPYDWGTTGILYDQRRLARPTSWAALNPADGTRFAVDGDWLVALGLSLKEQGYSLNTADEAELRVAAEALARRVSGGAAMVESVDSRNALAAGELDAGMAYSGDAAWAMARNPRLAFVIPDEGADLYVDVLAIPRGTRHEAAANALVDFFLRPDVHRQVTAFTGYGNPNRLARDGSGAPDVVHDVIASQALPRLERWDALDSARRARWNRAWSHFEALTTVAPAPAAKP